MDISVLISKMGKSIKRSVKKKEAVWQQHSTQQYIPLLKVTHSARIRIQLIKHAYIRIRSPRFEASLHI